MFDIRVKNFRLFKDEQFDFKQFNMLYGVNSGGKSSLLKLLLALKESIDQANKDNNITFYSSLTGLSSYIDVVRNNKGDLDIGVEIAFPSKHYESVYRDTMTRKLDIKDFKKNIVKSKSKTIMYYNFSKQITDQKSFSVSIKNDMIGELVFQPLGTSDTESYNVLRQEKCKLIFKRNNAPVMDLGEFEYRRKAFLIIIGGYDLEEKLDQFNKKSTDEAPSFNVKKVFNEIAYLLIAQNYLEDEILRKISYVNTTGVKPQRQYSLLDRPVRSISNVQDISGMVSHLSSRSNDFQKIVLRDLSKGLRAMGVCDRVSIRKHQKLLASEILVHHRGVRRNLMDVGLGTAHLILMLYKINFLTKAEKGMTILIMEPEAHIFPKLQSKFIEYIIACAKSDTRHTFIIESHSEYMMEKFQSEVKKKNVNPNQFAAYFFSGDEVSSHAIDNAGMINPPFPGGLFDTSSDLLKDLF